MPDLAGRISRGTPIVAAASLLAVPLEQRPKLLEALLVGNSHLWVQALHDLSQASPVHLLLVYDHLDAGFGSESMDFGIRRDAVTGLLDAWGADSESLGIMIRPKVLLREDVFVSLSLANVNRWRTRDVELRWDFADLAACLSNRAKLDEVVSAYLGLHAKDLTSPSVPPEASEFVVLFDERVRPREKQARTWLTAKNRLSDALGNRFPRDFLRLGGEALELERKAPGGKRYFPPAIIAGANTLAAIPRVSERRAVDLKDEFPDYGSLFDAMRGLFSPFRAYDLIQRAAGGSARKSNELATEAAKAIERLREYGVIGDWEVEEESPRLFVPDLHLKGLGMNRHGW